MNLPPSKARATAIALATLIVTLRSVPAAADNFEWRKSAQPNDAAVTFAVSTFDGSRFTFDARSGEIVSRRQPVRWSALSVLGVPHTTDWLKTNGIANPTKALKGLRGVIP